MSLENINISVNLILNAQKAVSGMNRFNVVTNNFKKSITNTAKSAMLSFVSMKKGFMMLLSAGTKAFGAMTASSPALAAQLDLIHFYFSEIFRVLGDQLAPVFEQVAKIVRKFSDWFKKLPDPLKKVIAMMSLLAAAVSALIPLITALTAVSSPWLLIIIAIIAAVGALYYAFQTNFGGIRDLAMEVFGKIKDAIATLKPYWVQLKNSFLKLWETVKPVLTQIWDLFKKVFKVYISTVIKNTVAILKYFITQVKNFVDLITAIFKGDWRKAWDVFKKILIAPFTLLKNLFKNTVDFFKNYFRTLGDKFREWGKHLMRKMLEGIVNFIGKFFPKAAEKIRDWLGFSLPKKGPLREVPIWGTHFAQKYTEGIQTGFERTLPSVTNVFTPSLLTTPTASTTNVSKTFNISVNVDAKIDNDVDVKNLADRIAIELRERFETTSDW